MLNESIPSFPCICQAVIQMYGNGLQQEKRGSCVIIVKNIVKKNQIRLSYEFQVLAG